MTIKSYKLGPGLLELGEDLDTLNVSSQVRAFRIKGTEKVERTDAIPVLSGEELAAEEATSYDWTAEGTLIQDIEDGGVVDWSWLHKGTQKAFRFTPSTAVGRTATGLLYPAPLDFGGDVDKTKRPETPLSWRLVDEPALTTDA